MPTLGEACQQLRIGRVTLEKWMKRLGIEPERHPQDWRYRTLTDEQLQQIAGERAKMPSVAQQPNMPPALLRAKSDGLDSLPDRFPIPTPTIRRQQPLSASFSAAGLPAGWMDKKTAALVHGIPYQTLRVWCEKGFIETDGGVYGGEHGHWRIVRPITARGLGQLHAKGSQREGFTACPGCPHAPE